MRRPAIQLLLAGAIAAMVAAGMGYWGWKLIGAIIAGGFVFGSFVLSAAMAWYQERHPVDPEEGWRRIGRWGYVAGLGLGGWNPRVRERDGRKAEEDGSADNDSDRA